MQQMGAEIHCQQILNRVWDTLINAADVLQYLVHAIYFSDQNIPPGGIYWLSQQMLKQSAILTFDRSDSGFASIRLVVRPGGAEWML